MKLPFHLEGKIPEKSEFRGIYSVVDSDGEFVCSIVMPSSMGHAKANETIKQIAEALQCSGSGPVRSSRKGATGGKRRVPGER